MRKPIFLCAFLLALHTVLFAQTDSLPPSGGILLSDSVYALAGKPRPVTRSSLEGTRKSLFDKAPVPPFDQRCEAACGSCTVVAALMIRYKIRADGQCKCKTPLKVFSWSYLHNQLVKRFGANKIYLKDALDMLKEQGIPLAEDFENTPCSHDRQPNKRAQDKAAYFKDWTYEPIFKAKRNLPGPSETLEKRFQEQLVPNTIAWLDKDIPVVIGLAVTKDFQTLPASHCKWRPPTPLVNIMGHALLVMGFDDNKAEFELLNSYGSDWGCQGRLRIAYEDFQRVVREGYVLKFNY